MTSDYRIDPNDFQLSGGAVTYGQQFTARVYAPIAHVLGNPDCFSRVANRIRVGDRIEMHFTDRGSNASVLKEIASFLVVGADGRRPVLRQRGEIEDLTAVELAAGETVSVWHKSGDPRIEALEVVEERTGQGRGKPALVTFHVKDGLGNIIESFKDRDAAEAFIAGGKRAA